MYTTEQLESMNKLKLRSACRDAKVVGYSKMTIAKMRAALAQMTTGNGDDAAAREFYEQELAEEAKAETVTAPSKRKKKAAALVKAEKDREERNGVKRPCVGGACRAVWDWLDKHPDAQLKDVREQAERAGWNANNAAIELYQWRKFNGVASKRAK